MLPETYHWILAEFEPDGDPDLLLQCARQLVKDGYREGAATVYDRAFGLAPDHPEIADERADLLDSLEIIEHHIRFRYIPGGVFLMGNHQGNPDERPWHPVWLAPYWLSETPISWATSKRLRNYVNPTLTTDTNLEHFLQNRLVHQYSQVDNDFSFDEWIHQYFVPMGQLGIPADQDYEKLQRELFGDLLETDIEVEGSWRFDVKPMVVVNWRDAMACGSKISTPQVTYSLPSEAQWEKAARGGRIGCLYPWGDAPPTAKCCDFNHFGDFTIRPMKHFAPNDYGLYAMSGGVWEWTRDWYDAEYYAESPHTEPVGPPNGREKVMRGGSWIDCSEVVQVSFRGAHLIHTSPVATRTDLPSPTIGFRLCRMRREG